MVHVCSSLPCFTVWSEVFSLGFHITYTKWWGLPTYERSLFYLSTTLKMFLAACWGLNRKCGNRLLVKILFWSEFNFREHERALLCRICLCSLYLWTHVDKMQDKLLRSDECGGLGNLLRCPLSKNREMNYNANDVFALYHLPRYTFQDKLQHNPVKSKWLVRLRIHIKQIT